MIDKDQVLQLVQMKGYVLPADLTRQFHADTFIMGAVLSDLVREKKLLISRVKIGRSPVYYTSAQRAKLQDLYKYLNEKDRKVYDLLKEEIVLRFSVQSPLIRVSLKTMKDFAKPIEVTIAGETEIFYKWYLATDQEVHAALTRILSKTVAPVVSVVPKSVPVVVPVVQPVVEEAPFVVENIRKEVPATVENVEDRKVETVVEEVIEKEIPSTRSIVPEVAKVEETTSQIDTQQHLGDSNLTVRLLHHEDSFAKNVADFFHTKDIQIIHFKHIKKGELDCVVKVPSAVGDITYFCKAKKKKKCNEGDLATVFVAAQMKKLPALFLTPGSFPKKVMQKLSTEYPNTKILLLGE